MTREGLPKIGDVVSGKYRIEKVVGEGGMGIVFAAHHLVLDQRVALKVLLVDPTRGEEVVERFVREAQAAAKVKSDHVVRVMDAGSLEGGLPFLVMEYLEGCDLDELLALEGPLPIEDVCDYMLQVLAALGQAHAAGIVHRDLKPANVFLRTRSDGPNLVKILDFGISKQESERTKWKELTGQTCLGTPAYMSPEQLRSSKTVDARADLWSLGVVMYELLTKKLPFDGDTPGELFAAILEKTPEPPHVHRPELPRLLSAAILHALQREPSARFADAGELARAIAPFGSGRWSHLVEETNRSVARMRTASPSGKALVAAALAVAKTTLPPPVATPMSVAFDISRTPTEFQVQVLPAAVTIAETAKKKPLRASVVGSFAAAMLVVVALVGRVGAHVVSSHVSPRTVVAAAAPSAAPVAAPVAAPPSAAVVAPTAVDVAAEAPAVKAAPKAKSHAASVHSAARPTFLKSRH